MIFDEPITLKSTRKSLKASASTLGLVAGAFSWSGLAQAASEETTSQMMLLPEHYELHENGVVVFKLETGENLSLTSEQYLILDDGLLLITHELAQASVYNLPVMGSVRAQLLSDLAPIATIDGTVAEATVSQTLAITQGAASRLSEQVDLQSYELAQNSDCEDGSDDEGCALPLSASSEASEGLALGMSVAPGAMALLGMLMTSDQAPENQTPMFASASASTAVAENTLGTVYTAAATDGDGDTPTYHLIGGADQALFDIDSSSGALTFKSAPDYENPSDASSPADNIYEVQIEARDGNGGTASQTVSITVTNVNEAPAFTSGTTANFVENGTGTVYTAAATDGDGDTPTYHLIGGADQALFDIDSSSGALTFKSAPDYEDPTDSGGDNVYEVQIEARDGNGETASQTVSITVTNVEEAEFWTDADIADSASTSITGTNVDSFVGYTAASTGAVADPISNFAAGMSNSGTINLSAGGNNYVQLGSAVAKSLGSATYIGADSIDVVTLTSDNVKWGATFTLQMGNGSNSLSAGTNVALSAGGPAINYSGGDDEDTIQIGDDSFKYTSFLHADMGNGINTLSFGNRVAQQGGNVTYIGGNDTDTIIAGVDSFLSFGTGSFTMGDGANSLTLGDHVLMTYNISYVGGMDSDSVTFGSESLYWFSPAVTFSMGAGSNTLTIGDTAAYSASGLQYTGGDDDDTITLGSNVVNKGFNLVMDVGAGTNSLSVGATAAFSGGVIDYDGGSGVDTLSFGDNLATGPTGRVEIDLGAGDTAADVVTFAGAVGTGSGSTVTIQNFNFNDDRIVVEAGIAATVGEIVDDGLGNLTWTDSGTNHKLIFAGIGAGGTGVIATSAELAAAII